ncbi:MAG: TonB-dependent receptor [Rhodothermales bacterium]|nr:TonB-dependent receptor [Rhodothermales bacterium]
MSLAYRKLTESIFIKIKNVRFNMLEATQVMCPKPSRKASKASATLTASLALIASAAISAQETDQSSSSSDVIEEIEVVGTRATVQRSIELKRTSTQIVDGLSADEIGDIPALSIGEALELVTGATSHRENGGATEISVRGLGPFLGTTVVNGREATNGGGNRAVNFSIFPSELFNKVAIHKTQSAEYIEGAVSGQIHLDTKKPLVYGKRLAQANVKLAYSPDESNIEGGQDYGSRATLAYIDQFEFDNGVRFGLSLGAQVRDETNPEQEYQTTSGSDRLEACELTSFDTNALPTDTAGRCHDGLRGISNDEIQGLIDSEPNYNSVADIPFAYIPRDHRYRHNTTDDEREAIFGSFQLQPNDRLDITLDFQYSERDQRELRKDLQFGTTQEDLSALTSDPTTGVVYSSVSLTDINSFTTDFQRLEKYEGYGINLDYSLTDNLILRLDYAKSDTDRTETEVDLRLGTTFDNVTGGNRDDFPVRLDVNQGSGAAIATILDNGGNGFEVTDPSYFNARDRARLRSRQIIRDNALDAFRADLEWSRNSAIHTVKAGLRSSSLEYFTWGNFPREDHGIDLFEDEDLEVPENPLGANNAVTDAILANVLTCADRSFPESSFLSNVRDGQLITNASSGTAVSTFATFNFECAANAWLANYGGLAGLQYQNGISPGTNDVTEDTLAFYIQADFQTEFSGYPVRGNFGVRVVDTDITSVGYRTPITVEETDEGFILSEGSAADGFVIETQKSDYQEILPSVTVIVDLADDLILRGGLFRGMSRPDPNAYGNGRTLATNSEDADDNEPYLTLAEAVNGIDATGNPNLKPIMSTNLDLGLEWYPNQNTMIAGALYWKEFNGAFENIAQSETFNIAGEPVQGLIETTQISDDDSTIKGVELTLTHSFDYLPGFWSGFGGKLSYNYADSNFEFEDQHGGDGVEVEVDQDTGEVTRTPLIGILPPANLFGLSKHVSSTQLYWDSNKWDVQVLYKTRSDYFQQYTRDTDGRIRYTDDNSTLDFKVRYKLFDNVDLNLEAKNVTDEPRIDYRAVKGNVINALSYGPRYFLGVKAKF